MKTKKDGNRWDIPYFLREGLIDDFGLDVTRAEDNERHRPRL